MEKKFSSFSSVENERVGKKKLKGRFQESVPLFTSWHLHLDRSIARVACLVGCSIQSFVWFFSAGFGLSRASRTRTVADTAR
jgi:hypothetical protein